MTAEQTTAAPCQCPPEWEAVRRAFYGLTEAVALTDPKGPGARSVVEAIEGLRCALHAYRDARVTPTPPADEVEAPSKGQWPMDYHPDDPRSRGIPMPGTDEWNQHHAALDAARKAGPADPAASAEADRFLAAHWSRQRSRRLVSEDTLLARGWLPPSEAEALRAERDALTADRQAACGELRVNVADAGPGTLAGRLVSANAMLRADLAAATKRAEERDVLRNAFGRISIVVAEADGGSDNTPAEDVLRRLLAIVTQRDALAAKLAEAERERDHWKANHDNQVTIKRAVLSRVDLPPSEHPERTEFRRAMALIEDERDRLREEVGLLKRLLREAKANLPPEYTVSLRRDIDAALAQQPVVEDGAESEAAQRLARMRAAGHQPGSDEEAQAVFDATMDLTERDAPAETGKETQP